MAPLGTLVDVPGHIHVSGGRRSSDAWPDGACRGLGNRPRGSRDAEEGHRAVRAEAIDRGLQLLQVPVLAVAISGACETRLHHPRGGRVDAFLRGGSLSSGGDLLGSRG